MKTNQQRLRNFWCQLERARDAALLLDYDGTLAPFTLVREQAFPYSGIPELLTVIRDETRTRLIIISGRAIADLVPLLGLEPLPEIWGCHGWEWHDSEGKRTLFRLPEGAAVGLRQARDVLVREGVESACEVKPASVALHWRGLDAEKIQQLQGLADEFWLPIAEASGLEVHPFNGGLELRPPGRDKGSAVKEILQTIEADVPVAFLGDDLTDEDGFSAIRDRGLAVLVNREARQTAAHVQFEPPQGLISFFAAWREKAPRKLSQDEARK
jgi:trehalose-phosphatase